MKLSINTKMKFRKKIKKLFHYFLPLIPFWQPNIQRHISDPPISVFYCNNPVQLSLVFLRAESAIKN